MDWRNPQNASAAISRITPEATAVARITPLRWAAFTLAAISASRRESSNCRSGKVRKRCANSCAAANRSRGLPARHFDKSSFNNGLSMSRPQSIVGGRVKSPASN